MPWIENGSPAQGDRQTRLLRGPGAETGPSGRVVPPPFGSGGFRRWRGLKYVSIISELGGFTYGQQHHSEYQPPGGYGGRVCQGVFSPTWP